MSRAGHVPIRMCMGCRKRRRKEEMIRFTRTADGKGLAFGEEDQKGKGFYFCPDLSCIRAASKNHRLKPLIEIDRLERYFRKEESF